MVKRLGALRRRDQPLLYVPNWLNRSMADALAALPCKAGRLPSDPVRLLYAGNIGKKQDLIRFCKLLSASEGSFRFRIHGNGGGADEIRAWVAQSGDPRFEFGDFMEEPAFAQALHDTDFFVITEKSGSGGSFIPCKTISGMAAGSPILAICDADSPLGMEIRQTEAGPWFSWDEAEQAVQLISSMERHAEQFTAWQHNALQRAQFYERDQVIDRCAQAFEVMAAAPSPQALREAMEPLGG